MKKIILIMSAIIIAGFAHAYAEGDKEVNQQASASFSKDFGAAKNISWQQEKKYAKVTFTLNDQVMFAYYSNENGQLIAVARNLLSDQLPINLMTSFSKDYKGYWITNLFEMASDTQTNYYVTLENAEEIIILKSSGFEWSVYKTEKK